jgi:hypothetical protein
MYSVILEVHQGSRAEYVSKKLQRSAEAILDSAEISESTITDSRLSAQLNPAEMPALMLMDPAEFPKLTSKQEFLLDVAQRCAMMDVAVSAPLLDGEEIREEFFTWLKEPFHSFSAGTGVLMWRTNMADLLYVFDHVRIEQGNVVYVDGMQADEVGQDMALGFNPLQGQITDIIKKLLSSAAGAAGGKIGAMIFNLVMKEIFGSDDITKFVDAVQRVIRDEIDSSEIDKINGHVQGTIQYLANDYQVRKAASDLSNTDERKELVTSLERYSRLFYTEVMGVLEQQRFARKGLKSYMLGASIHLIITQEMALVDWKTMKPNQSSFATTLQINAKHYREHVEGIFKPMLEQRLANISWGYTPDKICDRIGCHDSRKAWSWWDKETHASEKFYEENHKKDPSAKELAERGYHEHRSTIQQEVTQNAGDPLNSAVPGFMALEKNPIPV